jgi:hypothetical protein
VAEAERYGCWAGPGRDAGRRRGEGSTLASLHNIPRKGRVVLLLPPLLRGAREDSTPTAAGLFNVARGIPCRGGAPLDDTVNGFFVIESADHPANAAILSFGQDLLKCSTTSFTL